MCQAGQVQGLREQTKICQTPTNIAQKLLAPGKWWCTPCSWHQPVRHCWEGLGNLLCCHHWQRDEVVCTQSALKTHTRGCCLNRVKILVYRLSLADLPDTSGRAFPLAVYMATSASQLHSLWFPWYNQDVGLSIPENTMWLWKTVGTGAQQTTNVCSTYGYFLVFIVQASSPFVKGQVAGNVYTVLCKCSLVHFWKWNVFAQWDVHD